MDDVSVDEDGGDDGGDGGDGGNGGREDMLTVKMPRWRSSNEAVVAVVAVVGEEERDEEEAGVRAVERLMCSTFGWTSRGWEGCASTRQ